MQRLQHAVQHVRGIGVTWKRVIGLFWKLNPRIVLLLLLLTVLVGLVPSFQVQLTKSIVQSVQMAIFHHNDTAYISQAILFGVEQGLLAIVSMILADCQQYLQSLLQLRLTNFMSLQIMEKAITLDVQHFEDDKLYDNLQRATRESMFRPYQIFSQMISLASQAVSVVSVVVVLISWNWWIGLLILLSPLPSVCSQLFFSQKGYKIERERSADRRRLFYLQFLATSEHSFKEIRLFRLGELFVERYRERFNYFYRIDRNLALQRTLVAFPLDILGICVSYGAQIYAILFAIASANIGLLAGYVQAIVMVQGGMQGVLMSVNQLYQNNLYVSNLFEFLDVPASHIRSGSRPFPVRLCKGVEFRHVSFSYPGTHTQVLDDLNFTLRAGECVALVGHNGAGKTTIVKLLARLYEPTTGEILIDGIPIEEYELDDLRRHVGVIFQDFVQYEMSVQDNIGFGNRDELDNMAAIQRAAEESGAAGVVERLPQGFHTPLGRMFEKGQQLSIGQWQKVALARAFMKKAPVVVLDEPTASIDAEAEAEIFGRLRQVARGATTLLIAHRFSTVRIADRILVLEHGRVIEEGTHEALLQAQGMYAHLFSLQAEGYLSS